MKGWGNEEENNPASVLRVQGHGEEGVREEGRQRDR